MRDGEKGTKPLLIALGLLTLNLVLVWPLFTGEYTQYLASVEPVYMAVAKFIAQHPPYPTWNPLWYGGYPFRIFYTPLLPYALALAQALLPLSIPAAYRILTASCYIISPIAWYLLARYLTKRELPAMVAALTYILLPSIVYIIPPVRAVAAGYGYAPWQLLVLMLYGEGPHTVALAFIPLAALFFLRALREPRFANYLKAAFFIGLVALINFIALYGLGIILIVILISEMVMGQPSEKVRRGLLSGLLAYGLIAFWFNLSFIKASFSFGTGSQVLRDLASSWPLPLFMVFLAGLLSALLAKGRISQPLFVALVWLEVIGGVTLAWYLFQVTLAPQPKRYMPELKMAFTLLLGLGVARLYHALSPSRHRALYNALFTTLALMLLGFLSFPFLRISWEITKPRSDVTDTPEYQMAYWFSSRVSEGERVYVTGNTTFWLNLFSDVPQVRGGLDQSATNPWWAHVTYQINTGEDGSLAILWLQAFNVRYILVNYPESSDPFHDYAHPQKFEGLLEPVYSKAGDVIFEVPLTSSSLVRAVDGEEMRALPPIRDVLDEGSLRSYLQAVERGRDVSYSVRDVGELSIEADLAPDEAILVKMTYDRGWRAYAEGAPVTVEADGLGFMLISPPSGKSVITLKHGRVWDEWLGYAITLITIVALLAHQVKAVLAKKA